MSIAIIGAGSWGTAMASQLGLKHKRVALWSRRSALAAAMTSSRYNNEYLPGVSLPPSVLCTNDFEKAVIDAKVIVITTPSHTVRDTCRKMAEYVQPDTVVVSAAKGLEAGTYKRMSEIIADEIPQIKGKVAALSGPNHAEEVGKQQPSASVVASSSAYVADVVQEAYMLPFFRVYTNPDIIGVELGGALKNIIALGAGIIEGLGFGDNTKAALITRGLAEISRLGIAMGALHGTFAGLAGIGDLVVTCTSKHSRNRSAGILLAQGKTAKEIQQETNMVVEGIRVTATAYELANKYGISMPITEQIWKVIYQNKSPKQALTDLMLRNKAHEIEEVVANN